MKCDNLNISNKYIKFTNQKICFDKKGIYHIVGENGSGKSSLIKNIIFEENEMHFNTRIQAEEYKQNRGSLFSYVPQNIIVPDITVYQYLHKEKKIELEKSCELAEKLRFKFNLKQKVTKLSGGEREKLAIIVAIQKDTPYLILDEPTNNLDDGSVECLCELLEDLAVEKTVIIISHDPRVKFSKSNMIEVKDNKIFQSENTGEENDSVPKKISRISRLRTALRFQRNIYNIVMNIFFLCMMIVVLYFNTIQFDTYYCKEDAPESGNVVQYCTEYVYPNVNESYVKGRGLRINVQNNMKTLPYYEINNIYDKGYFDEMYYWNNGNLQKFLNHLANNTEDMSNIEGMPCFSVPEFIMKNYEEMLGFDLFINIKHGSIPKDNCHEIVLCEESALLLTGVNNVEEALGEIISYNEEEYTLVGTCDISVVWKSYQDYEDGLFYKYSPDTWEKHYKDNSPYDETDSLFKNTMEHTFFVTDNEQLLLDYLVVNYPASDYYSHIYEKVAVNYENKELYKKVIFIDLLMVLFVSVIFMILGRSTYKNEVSILMDLENYHICRNTYRNTYVVSKIFMRLFTIALIIMAAMKHSSMYTMNIKLICMCCIIVALSEFVNVYYVIRQLGKR